MIKGLLKLLVLVAVLLVLVVLGRNFIVKAGLETYSGRQLGLPLTVQKVQISLLSPVVDLTNVVILNPSDYEDKILADIPRIYIRYDGLAILKGRIHLKEVKLHLKELVVIKNQEEALNIDSFKKMIPPPSGQPPQSKPSAPEQENEGGKVSISSLELKIGTIYYKDYSKGPSPQVMRFGLNIDQRYEDIQDPKELIQKIWGYAARGAVMNSFSNFNVTTPLGAASSAVGAAVSVTTGAVKKATQAAGETVQATTKGVQGIINLPSGAE